MRTLMIVKPGWKKFPGLLFGIGAFAHIKHLEICLKHFARPTREFWERFYQSHTNAPYFEEMIKYLTSSHSIFLIFEGNDEVIQLIRNRVVEIRTRYGKTGKDTKNILHASDSNESAQREIELVIDSITHNRL